MKTKTFLMAGLLLLCATLTRAQTSQTKGSISGLVLDASQQPISFANVLLLNAEDTSLLKAEYTTEDGTFEIPAVLPGEYFVQVSYVGLPVKSTAPFRFAEGEIKRLETIVMDDASVDLAQATVIARKPLVEVHPDKTVFNVEGSINATGSDAMELLRKAPGVIVDNNDNIILSGKNGVRVFINNKPTYLSSEDLANYLRTLQSSEIERIEVITNPSSKYEAEGNAGIINIKLKKDKRLGTNGTVNLGYSHGIKQRYNGGISGNYRNKVLNVFGSYNYYDGANFNENNLYREQYDLIVDQRFGNESNWKSHNLRLGTDFFLDKKSTIGFLLTSNKNNYTDDSEGTAFLSSPVSAAVDSTLMALANSSGERDNYNANLNYRFDDGKGLIWNLDLDYGFFKNNDVQNLPNTYLAGDGSDPDAVLSEYIYKTIAPTDIDIYAFKLDHERNIGKGKLSAGVKTSYVKTDNDFQFFNVIEDDPVVDPDRTNHFIYTEWIQAAYANYQHQLGKVGFQAGLRVEHTNSEGDLTALKPVNDQNVKRDYLDFFPSAGITWQVNDMNMLQATYSRRLDRPSYQDLNPFEGRVDELTFQKGNPFLNPQYTNSVQLTHTYRYMYNTSISYSKTTDLIANITDVDSRDSAAAFLTTDNLASQKNLSLTFSAPVSLAKWWNSYANLNAYRTHNLADFGDDKTVDITVYAFNIYMQHSFTLPRGFVAEISGWYNSPAVWEGTFETDDMWSIDAGVQKKFLGDALSLKLSVSDIFHSQQWSGSSKLGVLHIRGNGYWDSQRLKVNLTWNFGNQQVKSARRRSTGLEEEQKRIKTND